MSEGDHLATRLELAEEENVVDQLARLLDLLASLLHQLADVGTGQSGALEQREEPGERSAELVRDSRGETSPQLLVGGELRRRIDEQDEKLWMGFSNLLA